MQGRLVVAACLVLVGCGSTKHDEPKRLGDGGATASEGGAPSNEAGGAAGMTQELSLDVVARSGGNPWLPAVGAHVRVDGSDSSIEVVSDEAGHVVARVEPDSGPWDVTVAMKEHCVISVLGVTESLAAPIHLSSFKRPESAADPDAEPQLPERRKISGSISGRNWPGSVLDLSGPWRGAVWGLGATSYSLSIDVPTDPSLLRVLATEWDSNDEDAAPLNAVWVDVPETGDDPVDILLPSPARKVARSTHTIELPSTGAVVGADFEVVAPMIRKKVGDEFYKVGRSRLSNSADENNFSFTIEAFTGDLAPNRVDVELKRDPDGDASQHILASFDPSTERSLTVPPADALETNGETLDDLRVSWSAPAYSHAGASISAWEGGGAWYTYTFSGSESATRPWPRLPDGVTREEVGLDTEDFRANVFAVTQHGVPWDWEDLEDQRALVVSKRLSPEPPISYEPTRPTGPLYAYDGIYSLTDVTLNSHGCVEEGFSILDEYVPGYFVVVGLRDSLRVRACRDVDDCKEQANALWENMWLPSEWSLDSGFPSWDEGVSTVTGAKGDDDVCTEELDAIRSTGTKDSQRFTVQTVVVPPHPPGEFGECSVELARAAAEGVACSSLKVYTGEFYAPLY